MAASLFHHSKQFVDNLGSSETVIYTVENKLHPLLVRTGVPDSDLPTTEEFSLVITAVVCTLIGYFVFFGQRHHVKRKRLKRELKIAQMKIGYLEEKLSLAAYLEDEDAPEVRGDREIRIFMDGAFDMMHYGHMNAFRLARSLGTHLVVGVNSDDSVIKCKGAPLMNDQERLSMVQGCKFVDEVVPGCPYIMNKEYLDYVMRKYKIDYVIHGDDPCIVDGKDVYEAAKASGKFRSIPRTEGVSTTDIIGRMLLMTREHHFQPQEADESTDDEDDRFKKLCSRQSKFLTTSRMLRLFSANVKNPTPEMRVIYIDGAWDMFHPGHVCILKEAKKRGDYLIVGIHGDSIVNEIRGSNEPLMNLHERVLSVLGCRFVDDVLIDAPWVISEEMIKTLNIAEVVYGDISEGSLKERKVDDRYAFAKKMGIVRKLNSPSAFSLKRILSRITRNQQEYQAKFARKMKIENDFYKEKYSGEDKKEE